MRERVQRVVEGIVLVPHETVQDPERHLLAVPAVAHFTRQRRHVGKLDHVGQVPADREVRVLARIHFPDELQHQAAAILDRGIALLQFDERREELSIAPQCPETVAG